LPTKRDLKEKKGVDVGLLVDALFYLRDLCFVVTVDGGEDVPGDYGNEDRRDDGANLD